MGRPMLIVILVVLLMATGMALASPVEEVRHPLTTPASVPFDTVIVEKGDHLWKISEEHLDAGGAVAPYWRRVVDVNTPRLRSGDPDLLFPGEVIELPPVSGPP